MVTNVFNRNENPLSVPVKHVPKLFKSIYANIIATICVTVFNFPQLEAAITFPPFSTAISRYPETKNSLARTREKIESLQNVKENKKVNKSDLKEYENKIRELIDIDDPSRELLQALIDKIIIDKDRNVEIVYKFSILNN